MPNPTGIGCDLLKELDLIGYYAVLLEFLTELIADGFPIDNLLEALHILNPNSISFASNLTHEDSSIHESQRSHKWCDLELYKLVSFSAHS